MMAAISNMVGERIVEILTLHCQTNVASTDRKIKVIRQGLRQSDPTQKDKETSIYVQFFDPSKEDSADGMNIPADKAGNRWEIEPYSIGGGIRQWRRFVIDCELFFISRQYNRDQARDHATWMFANLEKAITDNLGLMNSSGYPLTDEFNETASLMLISKSKTTESGGPPASFIWLGKFYIEVLCERL